VMLSGITPPAPPLEDAGTGRAAAKK